MDNWSATWPRSTLALMTRTLGRLPSAPSDLPPQGQWTYADYRRLPDDGWRYEVIRGVLHMAPAPRPGHQKASGNIFSALDRHAREHVLGEVYAAPIDVILPGLADPVQPDILFIARSRLHIVREKLIEGAPDLVVEVLSPSNWFADQRVKFEIYAAAGVNEYWIVDAERRTVEVYGLRDGAYKLLGKYGEGETAASGLLSGFSMSLAEILRGMPKEGASQSP